MSATLQCATVLAQHVCLCEAGSILEAATHLDHHVYVFPVETIRKCEFSEISDVVVPLFSSSYQFKRFIKPRGEFRNVAFPLEKVLQYWFDVMSNNVVKNIVDDGQ